MSTQIPPQPGLSTPTKSFDDAFEPSSSSTPSSQPSSSSSGSLKRRASSSFDCSDQSSHKKLKEDPEVNEITDSTSIRTTDGEGSTSGNTAVAAFADDIADELQCGCCSEIVYRPVLVMPCQHFFCGSCVVLWVRNGGTVCPACRGISTVAIPFRALQPLVDAVLRNAPTKTRALREREQADEVYKGGLSIRIPPPKEASPPPDVNRSAEFVHPCPHCPPNNPYDWRCPAPIPDPVTDLEHAWHVDDGIPPGHGNCGNCENLLALRAPTTTKCDLCCVSFCGIGIQDRCSALPILAQHPHNLTTHADLILSAEVYDCFEGNTVEAEIMLEYLSTQGIAPRQIYREIVNYVQKQPRGLAMLVELELFSDFHIGTSGAAEPVDIDTPRSKACRMCAAEIFLWGLKEWWVRERKKGFLEERYANRKDCPQGEQCTKQKHDLGHAKEFNHVFPSTPDDQEDREPVIASNGPTIDLPESEAPVQSSTPSSSEATLPQVAASTEAVLPAEATPEPQPSTSPAILSVATDVEAVDKTNIVALSAPASHELSAPSPATGSAMSVDGFDGEDTAMVVDALC
ncbi:hypothetical protein D9613_006028 [Agrocybe pediades]|uniref:RING-type domain-containing protein n=1 Tax=Agrocybe pediades TaxID=84607 RepID=A0A8H4QVF7_9AGAR|nr:hypothetical protein D9613_006028 [Agrocybe pediades]